MLYLSELNWLRARDRFRADVLRAMDLSMTKSYALETGKDRDNLSACPGWGARDGDLPALFKALDAQFAENMSFLGFALRAEGVN